MSPNDQGGVPAAPTTSGRTRRPPRAWRALFLLLLLAAVGVAMLFVGQRYGDRIFATVGSMWDDIFGGPAATAKGGDASFFTCGMHPWVVLPAPGLCPICHMDLVPLDPSKFTGEIAIDPVVVQNIGVRTEVVASGPVVRTIRTVGKVDYDETRLRDIDPRISGWIEGLHVDSTGAAVTAGQPLFGLYAPELFSAQQEYLLALRQAPSPESAFVPAGADGGASALTAARQRLVWFGIDDEQIAALERSGAPSKTMTIKSPIAGTVIEKKAVDGMRVMPGMRLYRLADLTAVWVTAAIYEDQLPFVAVGQQARMTLPYLPGREFEGAVAWVSPWTDDKTRQIEVRLEFDNADGRLRPGMFATVELRHELEGEHVLVGRAAVIDTGERQVAMISLGGGRFEPRELQLGAEADAGRVEVLAGLAAGERVVTSAQFLLDSESRMREGLLRMLRTDLAADEGGPAPPGLAAQPPALQAALADALARYLTIGDRLAADTVDGVAAAATDLAAALTAAVAVPIPDDEHFWHHHRDGARAAELARTLAAAADLARARLLYFDVSEAVIALLRATGVPAAHGQPVHLLHCPMFEEARGGAFWLQHAGMARNPYFGSEMLVCFDSRAPMPIVGAAPAATEKGR